MLRIFLFILIVEPFFISVACAEESPEVHAARGDRYRLEGRFEEAVAEYKEALRLSGTPSDTRALPVPRDGVQTGWAARQHREAIRLDNPETH